MTSSITTHLLIVRIVGSFFEPCHQKGQENQNLLFLQNALLPRRVGQKISAIDVLNAHGLTYIKPLTVCNCDSKTQS